MILITTKRGHAGKTSVSYSGNVRYSGPARLPDLMNSWDFANYFNEANANAGQAAVFNDETLGRIQAFIAGEIPLYEGVDGKFRPQTTIANGNSWHFHQQANDNVDGTVPERGSRPGDAGQQAHGQLRLLHKEHPEHGGSGR